MAGTPISLKLYGPDDEVTKTMTRSMVPWGILKKAVKMSKKLDVQNPNDLSEEVLDELAGLVVAIFGDRVTIEELDQGADISDMVAVIEQIVNKAGGLVPNLPPG